MPRRVVSPGQVVMFEGVNRSDKPDTFSNLLQGAPYTRETLDIAVDEYKKKMGEGPMIVLDSCTTPSTPFFSDAPKKKRAKKEFSPKAPRNFLAAVSDARDRIEAKGALDVWKTANSSTVLGLYGVLHENLYGFLPEDLSDEWVFALRQIQSWMTRHFQDDISRIVAFLRWKFAKEKRLRADNQERERLIWKWVFNQRTVMDYKAARGAKR